jgi:glycosyltransferase involved in cell wall biosynthesis
VTAPELHFVVPGSLDQRTGGYLYDARMVEGLRRRGWVIAVHSIGAGAPNSGGHPRPSLAETLRRLPDGARVVIDGLAMGRSPDVVRAHKARLTVLALVHLPSADEPGLESSRRAHLSKLEREALEASAGVIATSSFTAARVQDWGIDPASVRTVLPGTDRAPPARGEAPGAPRQLLCVASVTPGKGQSVLVRALTRLADVPWRCVCAGSLTRSPAYAQRVQALVRDAGLDERIGFLGECGHEAMEALYLASSIFVLPSFHESYGMVLTEAMARGLPIVTTDAGAIPDTVPAGAGVLVPPGDDVALAGALRALLVDAPNEPHGARRMRAQLGAAARRHAAGLRDWERAVDDFSEAVSALARHDHRRIAALTGSPPVRMGAGP